jgi:hypothetical protein
MKMSDMKTLQGTAGLDTNLFVTAEGVLLGTYGAITTDGKAGPIGYNWFGYIESLGLQQQNQVQRLFEVGSRKAFQIPGRDVNSIMINRILLEGPSLLGMINGVGLVNAGFDLTVGNELTEPASSGNWYINLAATYFRVPRDLYLAIRMPGNGGMTETDFGIVCLEKCLVVSHAMQVQSMNTIVMEQVQLQAVSINPI